jgi:Zn-dependent protease
MLSQLTTIQKFAVSVLPVLFAITVHEVAHGYVANLLGDRTAKMMGRLTLNPIKHIDIVGTVIVPLVLLFLGGFIFGWAKPVPISARNLRKPARDLALIAVAGPASNLMMMLLWAFIAKAGQILVQQGFDWALAIFYMGQVGIGINVMLAVLNLLPLPPLDGGHILLWLLPNTWAAKIHRIEPFGFFILLLLMAVGALGYILGPPVFFLINIVAKIVGL